MFDSDEGYRLGVMQSYNDHDEAMIALNSGGVVVVDLDAINDPESCLDVDVDGEDAAAAFLDSMRIAPPEVEDGDAALFEAGGSYPGGDSDEARIYDELSELLDHAYFGDDDDES